jgi:hypothetical protein
VSKAVVFISHISEERDIAQALKGLVELSFLGLIDVFVSSDANSIKLGRKWLDNVTAALKCCNVEIVIASPTSVKRPWVNFEAGAGWVRDVPVIPLCHSGMTPSSLPTPLSELQAALATDKEELARLVPVLAEAIGSAEPLIDWSEFVDVVQGYEAAYRAQSEQIKTLEERSPVLPTHGLLPHELAALLVIGENVTGTDEGYAMWSIRNDMESAGYTKLAATLAITSLTRKGLVASCLIENTYSNDEPAPGAKITEEGWIWLEGNKDRLSLIDRQRKGPLRPQGIAPPPDSDDIPF